MQELDIEVQIERFEASRKKCEEALARCYHLEALSRLLIAQISLFERLIANRRAELSAARQAMGIRHVGETEEAVDKSPAELCETSFSERRQLGAADFRQPSVAGAHATIGR